MIARAVLLGGFLLALASPALGDPCRAVPDHGPAPAYLSPGSSFAGRVTYIGDGDSLCVALGPSPSDWVEVRIADFYAPELSSSEGPQAKNALVRIAYGHRVECIADHQSYDRIVAACTLNGTSLGDRMRDAGVSEGGRGYWRSR